MLNQEGKFVNYKVDHTGVDEVHIQVVKREDPTHIKDYANLLHKAALKKLNPLNDYIPEVKEEIILYNQEQGFIIGYCVVLEGYSTSLKEQLNMWGNYNLKSLFRTWFRDEKLSYFLLQALCAMEYLH